MSDWLRQARCCLQKGQPAALVTVLAAEGSTPREAGTKMVVWAAGQAGTIGGGALEHQATMQARRMLALGEAARFAIQDYPLGPLLAQCCGGRVRLLIERLGASDSAWLAAAARHDERDHPFEIRTILIGQAPTKAVRAALDATPAVTVNGRSASARGDKPASGDEVVERLAPMRPRILLCGAGHVGQAIARALEPLPFRLRWCDSRTDSAGIDGVTVLEPRQLAAAAAAGEDFTLVLTHDHGLDYAIVSAALAGPGQGYLGLIGSQTKRARFVSRLRADGFSAAALERLACPIGVPQLKSKAPEIIAASVAADLLLRREAVRHRAAGAASLASL